MLNIYVTDSYFAAQHFLLEEEYFTEEVLVEASKEPFHLTCSLGHDKQGNYITWNLRYYNAFIEQKTLRQEHFINDALDRQQLLTETTFKFRQLLLKAANRHNSVAQIAREQLATL